MKIIAIIPARYGSSRFPGKPLADICGKPMIWWVYNQVLKVKEIEEVIIATDDIRIEEACKSYGMNVKMTSNSHRTSTERAYEVAKSVYSDLYIVINGDEPLIEPEIIKKIIPDSIGSDIYVSNLMTKISNPSEVIDFTNIKVVTDDEKNALYFSRSPIPYPKATLDYDYYKHVGVLIYSFDALRFFSETLPSDNEKIEDINELRYLEHGIKIKMVEVDAHSLSVDTPKDLNTVRNVIHNSVGNI